MESVKEVISTKLVEATTYLKGMSVHQDEVAFVGMGIYGRIMLNQLLTAGVKVRFWEPIERTDSERQIAGEYVTIASSLEDAIKSVQVVFVTLSTYEEVDGHLADNEDILKLLHHKTVIVFTGLSLSESEDLSERFKTANVYYMEAALCGSLEDAEKAQLKILIGCLEDQFIKLKNLLSLFGAPRYVGTAPKATAIKQATDLLITGENIVLALSTAYLRKNGINSDIYSDILKQVSGKDIDSKLSAFGLRTYPVTELSNDNILYSMKNIMNEFSKAGLDTKMLETIVAYTKQAKETTGGDKDLTSVYDALYPPTTSLPAK